MLAAVGDDAPVLPEAVEHRADEMVRKAQPDALLRAKTGAIGRAMTKAEMELYFMSNTFATTLRRLRTEKGLSQSQLGKQLFVTRSAVARWESGSRLPNAVMIARLSDCLGVDINTLLSPATENDESLNVIMVDDRKIILSGGLPILEEALPNAVIVGFTRPSEAIEYAKANRVSLAFLDIKLGKTNGLDVCHTLREINPRTNVIFLTAYIEYSFEAWGTGASGFMLKPITPEGVQQQLKNLRYPLSPGCAAGKD